MRKVCIAVHSLRTGGAEMMAVGEAREFSRRGWKVTVLTFGSEKEHSFMELLPAECTRAHVPFVSVLDIDALMNVARHFRESKYELIISQLWFANTVTRIAARIAGVTHELIVFEQNVYDSVKSWRQFFIDRLLQSSCRKIVAISQSVRDSLIRHGIQANRIEIIHNAIDTRRFTDAEPATIRADFGLGDAFVYLCVGRLVQQKAYDVLLPAFAKQEHGFLLIAGDGELRDQLVKRVAQLGIIHRVHFLGIRKDVPGLLKAADCFVLASRWEGFGVVFAEAMASGLPIVASRVDGIAEVVDAESGILVPPEDVHALAVAMRIVREDAVRRDAMIRAGLQRVGMFSIEKHVDRVLALI
jgi:glycosyltransferase involved in cell wall biosynthesis